MLNINESMWRDQSTKPSSNAWGTAGDMSLPPRRSQFNESPNAVTSNGVVPPASAPSGPNPNADQARLKFMFSPEEMTEAVLFAPQKIGLEDAMERLSMVIAYEHEILELDAFLNNFLD